MSVPCTLALTYQSGSHLWVLSKPLLTLSQDGLAGTRGNSLRSPELSRIDHTRRLNKLPVLYMSFKCFF
jgi:hypothetical protein